MEDYEKLGVFYLGRTYSLEDQKAGAGLLLYDSRDLVTHGVCVGMTGSGKTGLCIAVLEEAALDGIPAIIIDPKGDLGNLLLTFPALRGEDFRPWINEEDARRKGLSPDDYAEQQAQAWKGGLAEWGESGDRIQRLRQAAEFVIYTPGSNAGLPVSILKSFATPQRALVEDAEMLRERIGTTVAGLLGLLGIQADPLKSREHILLSTILDLAWKQGQSLDLTGLIAQVQNPPLTRVGVLDLETFFPSQERFSLVMALNNLVASPGFGVWLEGEALDMDQMLHTPAGKPRLCIFSIAHLSDAERMFFVSLLLTQVLGWMRAQPGTSSLRALLYMDEIYGYFPPVANPPSKAPLLTLLKQARAFGLGILLATQNPVDLDYKGLANAGTWFLGRLQTERDKERVLEGLEGAAATSGTGFDRQRMGEILAGLKSRVFLMHNANEDAPEIFQSRWAMSYLRGPLTRDQIKVLMDPLRAGRPVAREAERPAVSAPPALSAAAERQPSVPPDVTQVFFPTRGVGPADTRLAYHPVLLGCAKVSFSDAKVGVNVTREGVWCTPITDAAVPVDWDAAQEAGMATSDLEKAGQEGARYAGLPPAAVKAKSYATWTRDFITWLYGSQSLSLLRSPSTRLVSVPGEAERDFRLRLQQAARETRDAAVERLRLKYAPKIAVLQERRRRAEQVKEREGDQARQQQVQTAISFGATLLGAISGRKAISASTIGRATTAARGVSRSLKAQQDVARAADTVEAVDQMIADLDAQFKVEADGLSSTVDPLTESLETISIRPKKAAISVQLVALAWAPYWVDEQGSAQAAY